MTHARTPPDAMAVIALTSVAGDSVSFCRTENTSTTDRITAPTKATPTALTNRRQNRRSALASSYLRMVTEGRCTCLSGATGLNETGGDAEGGAATSVRPRAGTKLDKV